MPNPIIASIRPKAARLAAEAVRQAAEQTRTVARQLKARGLSGRDIAAILKVSPQRVSQLLNQSKADYQSKAG
jgi:DNA-directed RNA polymerase specialized sigma subunit